MKLGMVHLPLHACTAVRSLVFHQVSEVACRREGHIYYIGITGVACSIGANGPRFTGMVPVLGALSPVPVNLK